MPRAKIGLPRLLPVKRRLRTELTAAERRLWAKLRMKQLGGLKFRRQHGIGPYIVDFYCHARFLVIEVDGESHGTPTQVEKDAERDRSCGL